jgi:hypothetical protein
MLSLSNETKIMRYILFATTVFIGISAHGMLAKKWFDNFQKVLIETLPMNRVYIDYGVQVFSFEVPADMMNYEDTSAHCDVARKLGLSTYSLSHESEYVRPFAASNNSKTKLLQSDWELRMCGLDTYPSQYTQDFCSERETGDIDQFKMMLIRDKTVGTDMWTRSIFKMPFTDNPWVSIPHYEYRQCYRYSQSLVLAWLKLHTNSNKRFLYAKITTIFPTARDYSTHYFEYWATEFSLIDILRLKRLMNSVQSYYTNDGHPKDTPFVRISQPLGNTAQHVNWVAKRVFGLK